jgi:AcrR family transcriptional regulator
MMSAKAATDLSPRDKILEAAEGLFARRGFAGVGISEIAEAVGLSKSSLFHHFRTKAQLHAAVMARILNEIETTLTRSLASGGTPVQRLDRWIDTIIDLMGEKPAHSRLLLRSLFEDDEISGEIEEQREANRSLARVIEHASSVLRDGMSQGEIRVASIPHTLQSLIGMIIYHFASGEFGEELLGSSVFSQVEVKRRKNEIKSLLHHSLIVQR